MSAQIAYALNILTI